MKGIGAVVLLLALGFGVAIYLVTRPPERGLSTDDLGWVGRYIEWDESTRAMLADAWDSASDTSSSAAETRERLLVCARSYERRLGKAPEALGELEGHSLKACEHAMAAVSMRETAGIAAMKESLARSWRSLASAERRLEERLIVLLPLPTIVGPSRESRVEPRLSEVATEQSGIAMEVRCWSAKDWVDVEREINALNPDTYHLALAGAAQVWGGQPNLAPGVCAPLVRFAEGSPEKGTAAAEALLVLAHEMTHASGTENERVTECLGLQQVRSLARAFGAKRDEADRLALLAWNSYQSLEQQLPQYWSPGCRSGGPLDERPGGLWP